jgi:hypothetical protein
VTKIGCKISKRDRGISFFKTIYVNGQKSSAKEKDFRERQHIRSFREREGPCRVPAVPTSANFTKAFHSIYVSCQTQAQIDRLFEVLSLGGEVQPCGWVKDRFGVSWQIVPDFVLAVDEGTDTATAERINVALIPMNKIDITALHEACDAEPEDG